MVDYGERLGKPLGLDSEKLDSRPGHTTLHLSDFAQTTYIYWISTFLSVKWLA